MSPPHHRHQPKAQNRNRREDTNTSLDLPHQLLQANLSGPSPGLQPTAFHKLASSGHAASLLTPMKLEASVSDTGES